VTSNVRVDYERATSIALVTLACACAGSMATLAHIGRAPGASARAANAAMNCATIGLAFECTRAIAEKANGGRRDWHTAAIAGAVTGGTLMSIRAGGRGNAGAIGAGGGFAVAAIGAIALAKAKEWRSTQGSVPKWFPIRAVEVDVECEGDERELFRRMKAATRGELSAEDEASTKDEYLRWKMRRTSAR